MGEYDNAGFPLSYCLLTTAQAVSNGKRKRALQNWAQRLKERYGIEPRFVHVDKDMSEIGMIQAVWRLAKIMICWWHMKRALNTRISASKISTTPYTAKRANNAHDRFPFIDPTFRPPGRADRNEYEGGRLEDDDIEEDLGEDNIPPTQSNRSWATQTMITIPARQPHCQTRSSTRRMMEYASSTSGLESEAAIESEANAAGTASKRTFCPPECQEPLIEMFEDAYCAHPMLPGYAANHPEAIYEWGVKRIYKFCTEKDLRELWAYLWMNWLRPERWKLWARSANPVEISVLKTTMIMESQ